MVNNQRTKEMALSEDQVGISKIRIARSGIIATLSLAAFLAACVTGRTAEVKSPSSPAGNVENGSQNYEIDDVLLLTITEASNEYLKKIAKSLADEGIHLKGKCKADRVTKIISVSVEFKWIDKKTGERASLHRTFEFRPTSPAGVESGFVEEINTLIFEIKKKAEAPIII